MKRSALRARKLRIARSARANRWLVEIEKLFTPIRELAQADDEPYDGPLLSGEIGSVENVRFITSVSHR